MCCLLSAKSLSTVAHLAPLSMGFSRQEHWSGLPCPPPGYLPDPGIELTSLRCPALAGGYFTTSATWLISKIPSLPSHPAEILMDDQNILSLSYSASQVKVLENSNTAHLAVPCGGCHMCDLESLALKSLISRSFCLRERDDEQESAAW